MANNSWETIKETAKNAIMIKIRPILIRFVLPAIILIILAGGLIIIIKEYADAAKESIDSFTDTFSELINTSYKEGKVDVKDEDVDKFLKTLEKNGVKIEDMGIAEDTTSNKTKEERARYYIKDFMIANFVTQTVKTSDSSGDNAVGGILLQRHDAKTNKITQLTYSTDLKKDTFTVDGSGNIQYLSADGTTQTLSESSCKSQEIPIMFFIDICLTTENPEYAKAMADYIIENSKNNKPYMTVTIQDSYYEQDITGTVKGEDGKEQSVSDSITTASSSILVTKVDSLMYKLEQTYTQVIKKSSQNDVSHAGGADTYTTTTNITYTFSDPIQVDPVIYSSKDKETNPFYKMSIQKYRVPFDGAYKDGRGSLVDGADLLFELMDDNLGNDKLEQVLKYILYKWTGKNYGVTSLDSNLLDLNSFITVSDELYGDTAEEQVWFGLRDAGFSEYAVSGIMGNMFVESSFQPGIVNSSSGAYGLCQWLGGRKTQLFAFAQSQGKQPSDVAIQLQYLVAELTPGGKGIATYQVMTKSYYNNWSNATSCIDATYNFYQFFERGGPGQYGGSARPTAAQICYNKYHGKEKPVGGGSTALNGSGAIIGHFTSNITQKTFAIYDQGSNGSGANLPGQCNRAACASIASGYSSDSVALAQVKRAGNNLGSEPAISINYFKQFGLNFSMIYCSGSATSRSGVQSQGYKIYSQNVRKVINSGKYMLIWIQLPYSKNGITWTGDRHWLAILGYDNTNNKVFISDSGHRNSGWHSIDELDGATIGYVDVVSP